MIRPTRNGVLVRLEQEAYNGALHIPESVREQSRWGTVASIGPKVIDLKPGDRVFFTPQRSFHEIHEGDAKFKLFREQDLEAVVA